mmetsp:Transcript_77110/g.140158  ORF Transcript_77110/g.140158 Transcript_77110/m.140158 type:complete len:112 (+) Transcript_77110:2-337(+)
MTPGVEMSPVDLIRNFVIEQYKEEPAMRKAHATYWSPLEAKAGASAEGMEQLLRGFLTNQGFKLKHRWQLYGAFIAWWRSAAATEQSAEEHATARLEEILASQGLAPASQS